MRIQTECDKCGAKFHTDDRHIGRVAPCPKCGNKFAVSDALAAFIKDVNTPTSEGSLRSNIDTAPPPPPAELGPAALVDFDRGQSAACSPPAKWGAFLIGLAKQLFAGHNPPWISLPSSIQRAVGGSKQLVVDAYWCHSSVKLPNRIKTPGGSQVTVLTVCVDIYYTINGGNIILRRVKLSRRGGCITGSNVPLNVAAQRTGEAWFASSICSESLLADAVQHDMIEEDSHLRRIMSGKWRDLNRPALVQSLADALNSKASPDQIAQCISAAGRGNDIVFTYTKAKGESEVRTVTVWGVSGNSVRAVDHKDDGLKSFRIDRISNARGV